MLSLLTLVPAFAGTAGSSSCADLTPLGCGACTTKADLTNYECHWCEKDQACHAIGSLVSACTFSNDCVSLSKLSTCSHKSVDSCPASDAIPQQIHIAHAGEDADGNPDGMAVSWFTTKKAADSVVQYGTSASALDHSASGSAKSYLSNFGWHHTVEVTGLSASTAYFYRVGDGANEWSSVLSFTTATRSADASIALSVFGDMGYLNSTVRPMQVAVSGLVKDWSASYSYDVIRRLVDSGTVQGVWHLGDIGYTDDSFGHALGAFSYEAAYNGYMRWLEPIASRVPYMVAPGNHESECHSPACVTSHGTWGLPLSNFSAFNTRWAMPYRLSGGSSNMWYSFNLGPLHIVSLNTETDWPGAEEEHTGDSHQSNLPAGSFGAPGEYLAWLEADLKAAVAERAAGRRHWIIAGGHRPFRELEATHGALFAKYKVDAYFAGHTHSYARETYTIKSGNHSMLHVVAGGPGCDEMAQGPAVAADARGSMATTSFATSRYASGILRANATALDWQLLDSVDSSVLDAVVLER